MAMSSIGTLKSVKRMPAPKTLPRIAATDFTRDLDISQDELLALLDLTHQLKANPSRFATALAGRYITLLFEKPSLRTRFTFELAIKQLGGDAVTKPGYQVGAQFLKPDFLARDQSLEADVNAVKQSLQAYDQTALQEKIALNRKLAPHWTASLGLSMKTLDNMITLPVWFRSA